MQILIAGGTGVIGREVTSALLQHGHSVRLLSRQAATAAAKSEAEVSVWPASITDPDALSGCAEGCDVVLHLAGIIQETPEASFETVNVQGTRNLLAEATRAGARRFVYVSSLGANRGTSDYHRSKRAAETIVRRFTGEWVIVRPGNVFGPGDEVLSRLLRWVRTSPAVPVIGTGEDVFQPIWVGDAAAALAAAVERRNVEYRILEIAGPDRTTLNDLLDRMIALTGRSPVRVPLPTTAAEAGIQAASALGVELPIADSQLRMLLEGNAIPDDRENALTQRLGIAATPLDEGLRRLADSAPEQLPSEGFGPMQLRVFSAESRIPGVTPSELIARMRANFARLLPGMVQAGAESGGATRLYEGATITLSLPVRGHIQVRVADVADTEVTLLTVRGHPLAGAVRFRARSSGDMLRFEVQVFDRAASITDFALMALGGSVLQAKAWEDFVRNVLTDAGGQVSEVDSSSVTLEKEQTERVERWLAGLTGPAARGTPSRDRSPPL